MSVTWSGSYNSPGWTHLRLAARRAFRRLVSQREGATSVASSRAGVPGGGSSSGTSRPGLDSLTGSTRSCVATAAGEGPSMRLALTALGTVTAARRHELAGPVGPSQRRTFVAAPRVWPSR